MKFEVVILVENHRQGEDWQYAEILNRVRTGEQTEDDLKILETRVISEDSPDLPKDALHINCLNAGVNAINETRLGLLGERLFTIKAYFVGRTIDSSKHTPRVGRDGCIINTTLQYILKLKIGAKVMLTTNVDVMDCLANGALGEVVGFRFTKTGEVKTVMVQFTDEKVGKEKRKSYAYLQEKYPSKSVTPIDKIELPYSLSKKSNLANASATVYQFPLKLSFSATSHKVQVQYKNVKCHLTSAGNPTMSKSHIPI